MTIPFQGLPDTRPGYAFQNPGDLGALSGGLDAVIAALIKKRQLDQQQQQIGIEQQRTDQAGEYQRGMIEQESARQKAARDASLAQLLSQREVGTAVQAMTRPEVPLQAVDFYGGAVRAGTIPPASLGEAIQMVRPENAAEVRKQGEPIAKEQEARKAEARGKAARDAFLRSLPPDLKASGELLLLSKEGGLDPELANLLAKESVSAVSPATVKMIAAKHPEWTGLPADEMVKLYVHEQQQRNEARFRAPSSGPDLDNVPAGIVIAVKSNEKTIAALKAAREDLLSNPTAIGWVNRIPGIADLRDVVEANRGDISGGITRASTAGGGQLVIYDNTGKAVNIEELRRSRQIPTIKDPTALAIKKIDRLIKMAEESGTFLRETYRPEFGFKPMLNQVPTAPPDSVARRTRMQDITGTYKP